MAGDREERSPLEGLGSPRQGAHRPGGSHAGGLLASLVAVVAVVGLLLGLYTAFGRPGGGTTTVANGDAGDRVAASVTPTAADTMTASATPGGSVPPVHASSPATAATGSASASRRLSAPSSQSATTPSPAASSPSPTATTATGPRSLPVVVLNQSRVAGRAARTAAEVRSLGWTVSGVGNFRGSVASTTVYYPSGGLGAAEALAARLGISRVRPAFAGVSQSALTVVLV